MNGDKKNNASPGPAHCQDIQSVLLAYMTRELGKARSELVARHLRKCAECQAAAAEIKATLDWIKNEGQDEDLLPLRLSDKHRRRMEWSVNHPLLDWMIARHTVISICAAILAILAIVGYACKERSEGADRVPEKVYPIDLRQFIRPSLQENPADAPQP